MLEYKGMEQQNLNSLALPSTRGLSDKALGALGGIPLIGGIFSGMQESNRYEENKNRDDKYIKEQREREDSAYQRAVEDMRKAGLNPSLMYKNGGSGLSSNPTRQQAYQKPFNMGGSPLRDIAGLMLSFAGLAKVLKK